jgi:quinolinate synthase
MEYEQPELLMEEGLRVQAKKSLDRMLEISAKLGL